MEERSRPTRDGMLNLGGGTKRGRPSSMESGGLSRGNPQGGTASWVLGECQDGQAERHKRHDFFDKGPKKYALQVLENH